MPQRPPRGGGPAGDGHELRFAKCNDPSHGGCTLIEDPERVTWGVHYEISDEDSAALDAGSGVARRLWVRKPITVTGVDGKSYRTETYVIPDDQGPHNPPDSYVLPIHSGAEAMDLPQSYRDRLRAIIDAAQGR